MSLADRRGAGKRREYFVKWADDRAAPAPPRRGANRGAKRHSHDKGAAVPPVALIAVVSHAGRTQPNKQQVLAPAAADSAAWAGPLVAEATTGASGQPPPPAAGPSQPGSRTGPGATRDRCF